MFSFARPFTFLCSGLVAFAASDAALADPGLGSLAPIQFVLVVFLVIFVGGLLGLVPGLIKARRLQASGDTDGRTYRVIRNASLTYLVALSPLFLFLLANPRWGLFSFTSILVLAAVYGSVIYVFRNG